MSCKSCAEGSNQSHRNSGLEPFAGTLNQRAKSLGGCIILLLLFCAVVHPVPGHSAEKRETFQFTKVDLDLLEQTLLLDQRLEREGLVYRDAQLNDYLDRLGKSLVPPGSHPERVEWRFRVLRDPLANALALPNGSVFINTGLLALLENQAQLASVLAHEITHVLNRHSYLSHRSYRRKMVAIHIFQAVGSFAPGGTAVGATISAIATSAQTILIATIFGYSRQLEKEADLYAVGRLVETGYNPAEMVDTFKLLQKDYEVELVKVYYNDHPKLQERVLYIQELLKDRPSESGLRDAPLAKQQYLLQVERVARHNAQLDMQSGRFRTALALSQKFAEFLPPCSENLAALAEAYMELGPRTPEPTAEELNSKGKKDARKIKQNMTLQEQEKILIATSAGQSAWKANQAKAEELFRKALELDVGNAPAHRGLGALFEKNGKDEQAKAEYRKYLEMQPDALDRLRIQRRLELLEKGLKQANPKSGPR